MVIWMLVYDLDRGPYVHVIEKGLGHFAWHTDASVGGGITGQIPLVHADTANDPHKEGHWCTIKNGARWLRILS